jgi:hypothetical protein
MQNSLAKNMDSDAKCLGEFGQIHTFSVPHAPHILNEGNNSTCKARCGGSHL